MDDVNPEVVSFLIPILDISERLEIMKWFFNNFGESKKPMSRRRYSYEAGVLDRIGYPITEEKIENYYNSYVKDSLLFRNDNKFFCMVPALDDQLALKLAYPEMISVLEYVKKVKKIYG